jgi:SMC interacting uncharacterized protein involved in chromosome segregation
VSYVQPELLKLTSSGAHGLFSQLAMLQGKYNELGNKANGIQNKLRDMEKDLKDEMTESLKAVQDEILALKRAKDETLLYIDEEFARKRKRSS